jgi:undecaprenyl-diphosphatase
MEDISWKDALFIGSFQAAAIFPAISRSGLTIAAGLFRKLDRETAAYFSFLLSTPAIGGAVFLQTVEVTQSGKEDISLIALMVGILSSCLFGYFAVKWMINYLKRHSLRMFAVYVWILGIAIIVLQYFKLF